jgi:hypothetical protein
MSHPNDAPAAAWYPDPQSPGQVRWWDGTSWTAHVSELAPSSSALAAQPAHEQSAHEQSATVTYIGRHAAGATPAPRTPASAPRFRPRFRASAASETLSGQLSYA